MLVSVVVYSLLVASLRLVPSVMAKTWQEHGKNMARTWQRHGKIIAKTWQEHGKDMARAWQKHGELLRTFNDFEPIRIQNERIAKDIRRF